MKSLEQSGAPGREVWLRWSGGPLGVESLGHSAFVQDSCVQGFHGDGNAETQSSHQPSPFSLYQMSQSARGPGEPIAVHQGESAEAPIRMKPPGFRVMLPQLISPGRVTRQVCAPTHMSPKSWLSPRKPTASPVFSAQGYLKPPSYVTCWGKQMWISWPGWIRPRSPVPKPKASSDRNPLVGFCSRPHLGGCALRL